MIVFTERAAGGRATPHTGSPVSSGTESNGGTGQVSLVMRVPSGLPLEKR